MAASTCGTDGTCDGQGACANFAADTVCVPRSCPAGSTTLTTASKCDGQGMCSPGVIASCAPYACAGDDTCKVDPCADTATDCAPGSTCDPTLHTCQ
jgi:hypothetical protein